MYSEFTVKQKASCVRRSDKNVHFGSKWAETREQSNSGSHCNAAIGTANLRCGVDSLIHGQWLTSSISLYHKPQSSEKTTAKGQVRAQMDHPKIDYTVKNPSHKNTGSPRPFR